MTFIDKSTDIHTVHKQICSIRLVLKFHGGEKLGGKLSKKALGMRGGGW